MRYTLKAMSRVYLTVFLLFFFMLIGSAPGIMTGSASELDNHRGQQKTEPMQLSVILERVYLDGEVSEEVIRETCWLMENFWAKYDQWQLVDIDESTMVFRKNVDDIS